MMRVLISATALLLVINATACQTISDSPAPVEGKVTYSSTVAEIPAGTSQFRAWVPLPASTPFQTITNLKYEPASATLVEDPLYGNRMLFLEKREPGEGPVEIQVSYDVRRSSQVPSREDGGEALMKRFLEPDRLGIIDKRIQEIAARVTAGHDTTMGRARAIYDHVLGHMDYDKKTPGWGRGDTARACDLGKGNCSDYHSLFISLARASGIPARFHYGLSLKPEGKAGAHCWATFHYKELGWVPVDISEADKDPSKKEFFFGQLSTNRIELTTGRDIMLSPPQRGPPLNFFIAPHVEIDGLPHGAVTYKTSHATETPGKSVN
jgi:transglutaminase-like putative cysteine protease